MSNKYKNDRKRVFENCIYAILTLSYKIIKKKKNDTVKTIFLINLFNDHKFNNFIIAPYNLFTYFHPE